MLTERFSRYFQKWTTVDLFQEQVNSYLPQSVSVLHTKSKQWLIVSLSPFYTLVLHRTYKSVNMEIRINNLFKWLLTGGKKAVGIKKL